MQKIKSIYFSPHKDGMGVHVYIPTETYLYFYRLAKSHYDKIFGRKLNLAVEEETKYQDDTKIYEEFLRNILPIDSGEILFEERILKEVIILETTMYSFGVRIDRKGRTHVGASVGREHIVTISSPASSGFVETQTTLFHYPLFMIQDWWGGDEESDKIPDDWVEELSSNIQVAFDNVLRTGLHHKLYFWFNLRQYLHPEFFWQVTENQGAIPPFTLYDDRGNEIMNNIDSIDEAELVGNHMLKQNSYESVTIENVFHNSVMQIEHEEMLTP